MTAFCVPAKAAFIWPWLAKRGDRNLTCQNWRIRQHEIYFSARNLTASGIRAKYFFSGRARFGKFSHSSWPAAPNIAQQTAKISWVHFAHAAWRERNQLTVSKYSRKESITCF
jgi:hypothetical protein